jgi:glutathione synthase/RimK-type ligase-like ATP-grasp enzyme
MKPVQITILTDRRYIRPRGRSIYIRNVLKEDGLILDALSSRGIRVDRKSWDDPDATWKDSQYLLFRSTWDYFDRFGEFNNWLQRIRHITGLINPYEVIRWNLDKHYLEDLSRKGIPVPPTLFLEQGQTRSLQDLAYGTGWEELILKPVVSGAARHTYRFRKEDASSLESLFENLCREESMMLQEFQVSVPEKGEIAFMVMDGKYTHAVLKKARKGDFRVQDDHGGTVHIYHPSEEETGFAEKAVKACGLGPVYARVDAVTDNRGQLVVSELELIEPELWFRFHQEAAGILADAIIRKYL